MEGATSERSNPDVATLRQVARRSGVDLTDDDLEAVAMAQQDVLEGLARLRAALGPKDEPAAIFDQQVGRGQR